MQWINGEVSCSGMVMESSVDCREQEPEQGGSCPGSHRCGWRELEGLDRSKKSLSKARAVRRLI